LQERNSNNKSVSVGDPFEGLRVLNFRQIEMIDAALAGLGPFGEVRLVKTKGKLRFIVKVESESMED
jgi:hypothetical protein